MKTEDGKGANSQDSGTACQAVHDMEGWAPIVAVNNNDMDEDSQHYFRERVSLCGEYMRFKHPGGGYMADVDYQAGLCWACFCVRNTELLGASGVAVVGEKVLQAPVVPVSLSAVIGVDGSPVGSVYRVEGSASSGGSAVDNGLADDSEYVITGVSLGEGAIGTENPTGWLELELRQQQKAGEEVRYIEATIGEDGHITDISIEGMSSDVSSLKAEMHVPMNALAGLDRGKPASVQDVLTEWAKLHAGADPRNEFIIGGDGRQTTKVQFSGENSGKVPE